LNGEEWEIIKQVWNSAREIVHGNLVTNPYKVKQPTRQFTFMRNIKENKKSFKKLFHFPNHQCVQSHYSFMPTFLTVK